MIDTPHLLEIIALAVATVATARLLSRLYIRYLKVEVLRYKCDYRFNHTVVYNDSLPEAVKTRLIIAYQVNKKSYLRMLFSRRPLQLEYWFNQEQRDAFFSPTLSKV